MPIAKYRARVGLIRAAGRQGGVEQRGDERAFEPAGGLEQDEADPPAYGEQLADEIGDAGRVVGEGQHGVARAGPGDVELGFGDVDPYEDPVVLSDGGSGRRLRRVGGGGVHVGHGGPSLRMRASL
jgi:hypothetical protein